MKSIKTLSNCDDRLLWDTVTSVFHLPALTAADELGLFALLDKEALSADEIANSLSLEKRPTEALLGVVAALGYIVQFNGKFYLNKEAKTFLIPSSPFYWGGMLKMVREMPISHSTILDSLKNNKPLRNSPDVWEMYEKDVQLAENMTGGMHSHTFAVATEVSAYGDFENVSRILDVGGGSGAFSIALAHQYPKIQCTILDQPVICEIAKKYIAESGLTERIDTVVGDFFKGNFPVGYDALLFSNIFHDWDVEECLTLSQRAFAALPSGGTIYIHEMLLSDSKDSPLTATSFSLWMIWGTRGKQYTAGEIWQMLERAGFKEVSITKTHTYYSLITGKKP